MFLVYVDECGYAKNWNMPGSIKQQPFHVAAAVAIDTHDLPHVCETIRTEVKRLELPGIDPDALGRGSEIKASQVDRGESVWGRYPQARDKVRRIYLDHRQATYFVVCIDKELHAKRYSTPEDPADLGLRFILERVQGFAEKHAKRALVMIDSNKREEKKQRSRLARLIRRGSAGLAISRLYGTLYKWHLEMANILEIHFGDSKHSLGLQIADFVARHAYSWRRKGKPSYYPGWTFIEPRLFNYPNYQGWGYKEFP